MDTITYAKKMQALETALVSAEDIVTDIANVNAFDCEFLQTEDNLNNLYCHLTRASQVLVKLKKDALQA